MVGGTCVESGGFAFFVFGFGDGGDGKTCGGVAKEMFFGPSCRFVGHLFGDSVAVV